MPLSKNATVERARELKSQASLNGQDFRGKVGVWEVWTAYE